MSASQQVRGKGQENTQSSLSHLNLVERLRLNLEQGSKTIKLQDLVQCSEFDPLGTCEQLLAFQKYDLFEKLRKKKQITEASLIQCQSTRELYRGYLQAKKGMTSASKKQKNEGKKQFNLQSLQQERAKERKKRLIKFAIIGVILLLCGGALFKYREYILKLLKLIVNVK